MSRPGPGPSGRLSYGQLEGYWIAAGGPDRLAPVAAAIAMAESGGRPSALNPSDNGGRQSSFGLWQISTGTHTPPSPNWADPLENARLAVGKWKAGGWHPWGTWASGAYKAFLKRGVPPVTPGGVSGHIGMPYKNPFRSVRGLTPERIDMGVDYAGSGPVYALGAGRIVNTRNAGWPGGTFIAERLSSGPLAGRYVYVAENITPTVRPGQQVTAGTVIGQMHGGIETGFAEPPGTGNALGRTQFSGANATAYGVAYSKLLTETGAPAGIGPKQGGTGSTSAGWPPPWLVGILSGLDIGTGGTGAGGAGVAGGLGSVAAAIQGFTDSLAGVTTAIDWLLLPSNWVRILCGIGGGILTLSGIFALTHVGSSVGVAGVNVSARPAALPLGILMITFGAVLLFVAFHNLPGQPGNLSQLLGDLRDETQAAASGQKAAA